MFNAQHLLLIESQVWKATIAHKSEIIFIILAIDEAILEKH